ncbi:type VII secretion target [Mycobacterium simiae]|uniref:type VII secretion target n=1 Tax=Mycobacterium simiae TaxID=1784 RepID=UPI00165F1E48|nr:type VII secretion target [Mycobacterium simiae]
MTTPEPTPDLPPYPYPQGPSGESTDNGNRSPLWPEGAPGDGRWQVPQYPPYIPEPQFDTSQGMPRSTLDDIHGTEDDMAYWSPSYPGELPPYWTTGYKQIAPGVWKKLGPGDSVLGQTYPASNVTGEHAKSGKDVFAVDYRQLEALAQTHDEHAGRVAQWADTENDFADRLLATHGKVAYATYLNVKGFNESRQTQAGAYAQRNSDTAVGLRGAISSTRSTDDASAAEFRPPSTHT